MTTLKVRIILLLVSLVSVICVVYSLYLQHYKNIDPCVLCLMQRYCMASIALVSFLASRWIERKRWIAIIWILAGFSVLGSYFAGRQLWLHSLPPEAMPACMPSLDLMIQYFPWRSILEAVFMGTGDCGKEQYVILGLSLPVWGLFYFVMVLIIAVSLRLFRRKS